MSNILPIPIPKNTRALAEARGYQIKVIAGPDGDLTGDIRPVEALVGIVTPDDGPPYPELHVLVEIEEDAWDILNQHGHRFWITFLGHIVPFHLSPYNPEDAESDDAD